MKKIKFTKMQALGNDYIIIDGWDYPDLIENASDLSQKMSDRHFGIGGDGIIFANPADNADAEMRIFNADGSEAEMCGNGIRQVAKYVFDHKRIDKREMTISTLAGIKFIYVDEIHEDATLKSATVDMGKPIFDPAKIPFNGPLNNDGFCQAIISSNGREFDFSILSMGNPHAVAFVDNVGDLDVAAYGKPVEWNQLLFPARSNVEFVTLINRSEIRMRVWERGSGETMACGTGACASAVASILNGYTDRQVTVRLLGGPLSVHWKESGTVLMTGGAQVAFTGEWTIDS